MRPTGMRNRYALAVAIAFAGAASGAALLAARGSDDDLVKLPVAASRGDADEAVSATAGTARAPAIGRVEYRLGGELPALAPTAPGYRLDAGASRLAVVRLAGALGLSGAVGDAEHGWFVGDGDRELRVQKAPGLPWYLGSACPDAHVSSSSDGTVTRGDCSGGKGSAGAGASPPGRPPPPADAPTEPAPAEPPPEAREKRARPPRPADLPTRQEAERTARDLFARLGVDTEGLVVEDAYSTWQARVERRVDGLTVVGWFTTASIGEGGRLLGASGHVAEPERIGDYPLAGATKGFERLRRAAIAGPIPLVAEDAAAGEAVDCSKPTVICDPPPGAEPAPAIAPAEPVVRTVTAARLALLHLDDKLVPVYVFELVGGDRSPPVPAVTDQWLDRP